MIRVNIYFSFFDFIFFILLIYLTIPAKDFQKWIGYADVKSAPVHFYVQRNSNFNTIGTPIPFELARVNEGNAMNLQTGKFTAPRPGIYFFSFTTHVVFPKTSSLIYFGVQLYLNGGTIGTSRMEEGNPIGIGNIDQWTPLTLQSTLNLKKGDQVWVAIYQQESGAYLADGSESITHFTGFMLEEDIVASL